MNKFVVIPIVTWGLSLVAAMALKRRAKRLARERFPEKASEPWMKTMSQTQPADWWPSVRFLARREYAALGDPEVTRSYDAYRACFAVYVVLMFVVALSVYATSPQAQAPLAQLAAPASHASAAPESYNIVFAALTLILAAGWVVLAVLIGSAAMRVRAYAAKAFPTGQGPRTMLLNLGQGNDWRTMALLWRREYAAIGDPELTRRYDRYRRLYFALSAFTLGIALLMVLAGLTIGR